MENESPDTTYQVTETVTSLHPSIVSVGPDEINPATGMAFTGMEVADIVAGIVTAELMALDEDADDICSHGSDSVVLGLVRVAATLLGPYLHAETGLDARLDIIVTATQPSTPALMDLCDAVGGHLLMWSDWLPDSTWLAPGTVWVDLEQQTASTPCWTSPKGEVFLDLIDFAVSRFDEGVEVDDTFALGRDIFSDDFAGVRHVATGSPKSSRWHLTPALSVPLLNLRPADDAAREESACVRLQLDCEHSGQRCL